MSACALDSDVASQNDEIEALSAIYGDDFLVVNEAERLFDVRIRHEENAWFSLTLQILFPQQYPSKIPPVFEVHGTWLADCDELEIRDKMYSLYREDETVVFQWVEAIREFMNDKALEYGDNSLFEVLQLQEDQVHDTGNVTDNAGQNSTNKDKEDADSTVLDGYTSYGQAIALPEIYHGEPFTDRKSTFQAHLANITSEQELENVLRELKSNRKIAHATHNIVAYRIKKDGSGVILQDYDEDGEHNAGSRLLHLLQILNVQNHVVMVSRWYGGILLGPDRFKHINNCARDLLKTTGAFADKSSKNPQNHRENKHKRKVKK